MKYWERENIKINKLNAKALVKLVKEHKKSCKGNCGISCFLMINIYKDLIGRDLTDKEVEVFS